MNTQLWSGGCDAHIDVDIFTLCVNLSCVDQPALSCLHTSSAAASTEHDGGIVAL